MLAQPATCEQEVELLLVLDVPGHPVGIKFPPGVERAFSVGAARTADFRLWKHSRPIEFFIERQDDRLILIPGYQDQGLRINGLMVSGVVALPEFATIECGSCSLRVRLYARAIHFVASPRQLHWQFALDGELPAHCFPNRREEPGIARETSASWGTNPDLRMHAASTTARTEEVSVVAIGAYDQTTTHVRIPSGADYVPTAIVPKVTVEIVGPVACDSATRPACEPQGRETSVSNVTAVRETTCGSLVGPAGTKVVSAVLRAHALAVAKQVGTCPADLSQSTNSANGMNGQGGGSSMRQPAAMRWQAPTAEYSAIELPIAAMKLPRRASESASKSGTKSRANLGAKSRPRPSGLLGNDSGTAFARLGRWAYRRPIAVSAIALSGGLVCALGAAWLRSGNHKPIVAVARVKNHVAVQAGPAPKTTMPPQPTQVTETHDPALGTPTVQLDAAQKRIRQSAMGSPPGLAVTAIEHLAAGRHHEALRIYERILEQSPQDVVSVAIVRILKIRLSNDCAQSGQDKPKINCCPEILP